MHALLRGEEAELRDRLDGVGAVGEQVRQRLLLGRREVAQDEIGGSWRPGGRPMPIRTRLNSFVPVALMMSRRPL